MRLYKILDSLKLCERRSYFFSVPSAPEKSNNLAANNLGNVLMTDHEDKPQNLTYYNCSYFEGNKNILKDVYVCRIFLVSYNI